MNKRILYHGSNVEVSQPRIMQNGFFKDFGYGFYCTDLLLQAKRWAITKRRKGSVVSKFTYTENPKLHVLKFDAMTDAWLDFVVSCRRGKEHPYDIIEGPMADDQIWTYVEDFMDGKIPRDVFFAMAKFNHPTHQIVFCTEDALDTLTFEGSEEI